jgi:hypothetical protein
MNCDEYFRNWCGTDDTDKFMSIVQCCVCGGGNKKAISTKEEKGNNHKIIISNIVFPKR